MINKQWMRAGVGACGVASLVLGAGLMFVPAANAAPMSDPTMRSSDLLGGTVTAVGGIVNGVLTPNPAASSPITVGTGSGGLTVGVGSTTVGVGSGNGTVSVGVTGTGSSAVGVTLGSTTGGTTVTGTVTNPTVPTVPSTDPADPTSTTTTTAPGSAATPIMLTALSVTPQYPTVYPAKDGYRDTEAFQLKGTTSDGQQHAASGTATLTYGSSTVMTWQITATDDVITWNGLKGGKLLPGHYVFKAVIGDASGAAVTGTTGVDVSAKKLAAATQTITTKSISGTHKMAAKPLAGLSKGKVTLQILSKVSGLHGKQYLVFKHGTKKIKVLIRNGSHTSKRVTIPKAFTTYTISHTWKNHTVKITSLKYRYGFKALK